MLLGWGLGVKFAAQREAHAPLLETTQAHSVAEGRVGAGYPARFSLAAAEGCRARPVYVGGRVATAAAAVGRKCKEGGEVGFGNVNGADSFGRRSGATGCDGCVGKWAGALIRNGHASGLTPPRPNPARVSQHLTRPDP
jgi:hypothetical protein